MRWQAAAERSARSSMPRRGARSRHGLPSRALGGALAHLHESDCPGRPLPASAIHKRSRERAPRLHSQFTCGAARQHLTRRTHHQHLVSLSPPLALRAAAVAPAAVRIRARRRNQHWTDIPAHEPWNSSVAGIQKHQGLRRRPDSREFESLPLAEVDRRKAAASRRA